MYSNSLILKAFKQYMYVLTQIHTCATNNKQESYSRSCSTVVYPLLT